MLTLYRHAIDITLSTVLQKLLQDLAKTPDTAVYSPSSGAQ